MMRIPKNWIPAFAGMTTMLYAAAAGADSLLPKKNAQPEYLPVDQAFALQPLELSGGKLLVSWRIAKDYYLYRDRLKFTLSAPPGTLLGAPILPASEPHHDEHFGTTQVFRGDLRAALPVTGPGPYTLTVVYQGCADAGLCYPPQTRILEAAR